MFHPCTTLSSAVRFQIDVVAVGALGDIVIRLTGQADKSRIFEPDMHVARHEFGPGFQLGLEHH